MMPKKMRGFFLALEMIRVPVPIFPISSPSVVREKIRVLFFPFSRKKISESGEWSEWSEWSVSNR